MEAIERLEKDLNGLGAKMTEVDKSVGMVQVRTERTEKDVEEVWSAIGEIRNDVKSINEKMSGIIGKVSWIAGAIAAFSVLLSSLLQEFLTK